MSIGTDQVGNRLGDLDLIEAVGQVLDVERALIVRRQAILVVVGFAHDLNVRLNSQAGRINHFQA